MKIRPLPANADSEKLVLGYLLLENSAWKDAEILTEQDFSLDSNKRIFACIRSRLSIGRPIDTGLLIDAMHRQKELDTIGGRAYIFSLTEWIPRHVALDEHIALLKEKASLRRILRVCQDASVMAYDERSSVEIMKQLGEAL